MTIRTYSDIKKLEGESRLSEAEKTLVENCKHGKLTRLGDGGLPEGPSPERTIRADLLRYLILGGCDTCKPHENGVLLFGAWVEGELDLRFVQAKGSTALDHCVFDGRISARQAHFELLRLTGSSVKALSVDGSTITGDVFLSGMKSIGEVSFSGAEIGGQLACNGAELDAREGDALNAQRATIKGGVFLDGLKSNGGVSFSGAEIGGQLSCEGTDLNGGESLALNAEGATIKGGVFLRELKSVGEVSFSGAEIGGQLSGNDADLNGAKGKALNVQGATIKGGVFLSGLKSRGEVLLSGAEIRVEFSCAGAELNGGEGYALNAQGATIKGSVFLNELKSSGQVSFVGAEIEGQLIFTGAELDGGEGDALNGQRMIIKNGLFWRGLKSVVGCVDLNVAHLGDLVDDKSSWDLVSDLCLVGVTYEDLAGTFDLAFRKKWLRSGARFNGQFHPQPYQQLAKFYRETGHRYEAREILIAKEIEQRNATREAIRERKARTESWLVPGALVFLNLLWDWTTRLIAGYGYKPWLSLWWLGGLVGLMMLASEATWNAGDFAPNSAVILTSSDWKAIADGSSENPAADWTASNASGKDYETFYSFAYALDVVVPVLDLGQTDAWAPSPARGDWGYRMFYLQKIFIVLGWVVTAIAAAAISGMIRRDD